MVWRTYEVRKIIFRVPQKRIPLVEKELEDLYGDQLKVVVNGNEVSVEGDLHNYKRRGRILWILSGGKIGADIQAS